MNGIISAAAAHSRPFPAPPHDDEGEAGRDDHRSGYGDAVSCRKLARRAKQDDKQQDAAHEQVIHLRHVDLAFLIGGRVVDFEPRQEPHWIA